MTEVKLLIEKYCLWHWLEFDDGNFFSSTYYTVTFVTGGYNSMFENKGENSKIIWKHTLNGLKRMRHSNFPFKVVLFFFFWVMLILLLHASPSMRNVYTLHYRLTFFLRGKIIINFRNHQNMNFNINPEIMNVFVVDDTVINIDWICYWGFNYFVWIFFIFSIILMSFFSLAYVIWSSSDEFFLLNNPIQCEFIAESEYLKSISTLFRV